MSIFQSIFEYLISTDMTDILIYILRHFGGAIVWIIVVAFLAFILSIGWFVVSTWNVDVLSPDYMEKTRKAAKEGDCEENRKNI